MRAGLSTIQQTLTTEAAAVLNQSIAEASRRNHGQTTPLHVAAALLNSPSGYLRQACIRSHPNSSHPFQCRALELCFSVALERLPTAQNTAAAGIEPEPPISNALTAALKRAQAHQRRGCSEQQQQPLPAVKVELDQLIISILDDPSVSRVMREAGFSSPAVKATIEQSLTSSTSNGHHHHHHRHIAQRMICNPAQLATPFIQNPSPVFPLANPNSYLNPRLQQGANVNMGNQRGGEINKLLEIMMRSKKKNPILVGDFEPESIVKELLKKIENKELGNDGVFKNARVISMEKESAPSRIKELVGVIENLIGIGGVIVDLGDLKWLVEHQHQQQVITEYGRAAAAVVEMAKLLARFGGDGEKNEDSNKVWLIGTATCETYLRCQVYYSTMESDWDLQTVPMASRSRFPGLFPRLGTERFSSDPLEPLLNPKRAYENVDPPQRTIAFCPQCSENYEKELKTLEAIERSFSEATQPSLPQWLQNAKLNATNSKIADTSQDKDRGLVSEQKTKELQKKWRDMCLHLHPNFHQTCRAEKSTPPLLLSMTGLYDPNLLACPIFQPKLPTNSHPESPVRTDLVLGRKGTDGKLTDFLGCISSEPQTKLLNKFANSLDADTYKRLLKRLMEKAWWQAEAASAVASAVTRCRLGNGKRWSDGSLRRDIWLLFVGPDRVGKKKMALVLAEQICGARPIMICFGARRIDGDDEESNFRGKTAVDRITEVVRRNPFSVIVFDGVDEAGALVRGSIKQAIERGRLTDSTGREVGMGNAVFVLAGDWSTTNKNHEVARDVRYVDEKRIGSWRLELVIVREKSAKRRASWPRDEDDDDRSLRSRKEAGPGFSFDLNLAAAAENECDKSDGSDDHNSSDVTVDHEDELSIANRNFSIASVPPHDLLDGVDDSIVFKPFDSAFVLGEIKRTISFKFCTIVDENVSLEVGDDVLEKILGGLLADETSLEEWIEKVLAPSFDRIKQRLPPSDHDRSSSVVRLVVESGFESSKGKSKGNGDWLPSSILV